MVLCWRATCRPTLWCPALWCTVVIVFLSSPAFCSSQNEASRPPDVLLLSVDTLRADALHSYGYPQAITPTLDALASEGVLFSDALTTIGKTGPAFASLFTSLSPPSHGARRNGISLRSDVPTLAETFKANGYVTAAFISNWTLRSRLAKLNRGFDRYDETFDAKRNVFGSHERTADAVIDAVSGYLDSSSAQLNATRAPQFLWVHFSEPHTPFDLHKSVTVPEPQGNARSAGWQRRWRYANEVAYTDGRVKALLERLSEHLDLEQTLIIFVGDHGESLSEHGYWGHGKNTHWPNLRVPLILKGPMVPTGQRIEAPVMITDIFPTILELLNFEPPEGATRFEGTSLAAGFTGQLPADRLRFTVGDRHTAFGSTARRKYEDPKEISLQSQTLKVVFDFSNKELTYFDLAKDPLELNPLAQPPSDTKPPWRRQLVDWYRALPKYEQQSGQLSDEDRRQLESLGYIGGD